VAKHCVQHVSGGSLHGLCVQQGKSGVRVVKLSKSGGVVTRPTQLRKVSHKGFHHRFDYRVITIASITYLTIAAACIFLHDCGMIRTSCIQQEARTQRVREYFYGPHGELSPHVLRLKFDEVSICRVGGGPRAPTSALPIGAWCYAMLSCECPKHCPVNTLSAHLFFLTTAAAS
jgi:hypothetical protein